MKNGLIPLGDWARKHSIPLQDAQNWARRHKIPAERLTVTIEAKKWFISPDAIPCKSALLPDND